jgi:hypothetical protein
MQLPGPARTVVDKMDLATSKNDFYPEEKNHGGQNYFD